jgi:hypothetical protein
MSTSYVDLKKVCNAGFETALVVGHEGWAGFPIGAKKLDGFPTGRQTFGRVPFQVAGRGKSFLLLGPNDTAPVSIAAGAKFRALYLLHTMDKGDIGGKPVVYTLRYADGSSAERVITVGEDVQDWILPKEAANCRIGWTGYHRESEFQKCVYVAEIVNPQPQKQVSSITVQRQDRSGQYVLLGLTLGTGKPFFKQAARGARVGLADYIDLASDVVQLKDGRLELVAGVYSAAGRPIGDARLSAAINGRSYDFQKSADGYVLSIPRGKGWRRYANTVRLTARRGGKTVAEKDVVLYGEGRPRLLHPPHGHVSPQFIIIGFDDCVKIPGGVEDMLEIIENVKGKGGRAVFTMYTTPGEHSSPDREKQKILYKRMYDLGCEFANHTLNHNPGGVNWFALPHSGQVHEIEGCRQWFRDNIPGVWEVYSQKSGGGGRAGFRDPKFTRELLRRQKFEYNANNVTALYDANIPHPDVQFWPYKLGEEWAIDLGLLDGNAPPVHKPITKGLLTDYSGKFDYEVKDGVEMLVANLDYRYKNPNRPPLIINAFHEWGLWDYWHSHRNQKAVLEGFLTEVLVNRRRKYPNTYCITFHELIQYMKRDDIEAIIAEGHGQGRR